MMKVGIKVYSIPENLTMISRCSFADFIEIYIKGSVSNEFINEVKKLNQNFVVHVSHIEDGVNIASPSRHKETLMAIEQAVNVADRLNAETIIIHPGEQEAKEDSLEHAKSILKDIDKRVVLENVPFFSFGKYKSFGYSPETLARLTNNICLDIGHAHAAAASLKIEPYMMLNKFVQKFNVKHWHVSDGFKHKEIDDHLPLGHGDYDIKNFIKLVKNSKHRNVTLETPQEYFEQSYFYLKDACATI